MTFRSLAGRLRRRLASVLRPRVPSTIQWGDFRHDAPFCPDFGTTRGKAVDRYYIEQFVAAHAGEIRGRVLELLKDTYATRYGGARVTRLDILNLTHGIPGTTLVADLSDCPEIPDASFDTIILTQALQYIPRLETTVRHLHRLLAPGGVLLVTAPAMCPASAPESGEYHDLWRFFPAGLGSLFEAVFGPGRVQSGSAGNLVAATAFLHGLAVEDLGPGELDRRDRRFPLVTWARAQKAPHD